MSQDNVRWAFGFTGGALSGASIFVQKIEMEAFRYGVKYQTKETGWLIKHYSMHFEGSSEAISHLKEFVKKLARIFETD